MFESLERREMLNAAPVAVQDPLYVTAEDTALVVGVSDTTLLNNDSDAEGNALTVSVVSNPNYGVLSGVGTDGTFTYTPNTSYKGVDSFTYKVNDGTDDSNVVSVDVAVGQSFGPQTNQSESTGDAPLLDGGLLQDAVLTPGVDLVYNSNTLPKPIIALETFLPTGATVPDAIKAKLTFNGVTGTTYSYDTTSLTAGDSLRFALQADATSLTTGRYDYSITLTSVINSVSTDQSYTGSYNVVNRGGGTNPYGVGWQLSELDSLSVNSSGAMLVESGGAALWFGDDGAGGYLTAEGDVSGSTLVKNAGPTYTVTDKFGGQSNYSSAGLLTSQVDRNGNTISYAYTSGLLTKITDAVSRDTTFTYTSGRLTLISDFASRSATLAYDGSGRLTSITQPDPDGAGPLASPVASFTYDVTTNQLTQSTDPLSNITKYTYASNDRLTKTTNPDNSTRQLTSLQTIGLPSGTSGNILTAAGPVGAVIDELAAQSTFRADRFGNIIEWNDSLGKQTLTERNAIGLPIMITEADPDGAGVLTSPVTKLGYDGGGDLVYKKNPVGGVATFTYSSTFNLVATSTDELGNTTSYAYDTKGNLTSTTDPAGFVTTFTYDSRGLLTSQTTPDPDGAGPQAAAVTSYAYDANGRPATLTNPDNTTRVFTYDTADNATKVTDERAKDTTLAYDTLNRLTSSTDRLSAVIAYDYAADGQVAKTTDALNNETAYVYNSSSLLTSTTQPDPDGAGPLAAPVSTSTYDAAGFATAVADITLIGTSAISYEFDSVGRRTRKNGPLPGMVTDYTYDSLGRLKTVVDPLFNETRYAYDGGGNLLEVLQVEDPITSTGPKTSYVYDFANNLISQTDPRGYVTNYSYNSRGLLTRTDLPDPDGAGPLIRPYIVNAYDNQGRLATTRNTLLRQTAYEYDSRDNVIKVTKSGPDGTGPSPPVTSFIYDAAGRLASQTDSLLRVTSYAYDDEGRVTKVTLPDPDGAGPLAAPETSYAYDSNGNVTSLTDPLGGITSYEYDNLQRLTKTTGPDPDGAGPLTAPVTTRVYNAQGKLDKVTDPLGRSTTFAYDDIGRRTGVTDTAGNTTTYAFNSDDLLISTTAPDPDGAGPLAAPVTSSVYDQFGRVAQTTDPQNGRTNFTYDAAGNLLTLKDSVNNTTTYAYDGLGNRTIETNQLGKTRSFYYDATSRLVRRVDRNQRVLQFNFDDFDRVTSEKWFSGGAAAPSLNVATTTEGGLSDEVQRIGFNDDMGMLDSGDFTLTFGGQTTAAIAWNATAATVQTALETLSNINAGDVSVIKSLDDTGDQQWTLTYVGVNAAQTTIDATNVYGFGTITTTEITDVQGGTLNDEVQTVTLANASGGTFRLAFNGETAGELAYNATAAQVETTLEGLNAVDNVTVSGAAGGPWTITFIGTHSGVNQPNINGDVARVNAGAEQRAINYTYDVADQLTSVSDPDSSYAYTYDKLGRVLTVDNSGTAGAANVVLTSAYDANSNRSSLSAKIGSTDDFLNSYSYDALNRLTRVDQIGQGGGNAVAEKRVDFGLNSGGQFTSIARFNDTAGGSANEVATSNYSYDTQARLTGLNYQKGGTNLFAPYAWTYDTLGRITQFTSQDGTSDYTYDATDQLTDAVYSFQTDEAFSYDANGNRTNTGYTTGSDNQLTNDGTFSYTYDNEGNRLTRTNDTTFESTEYDWDYRNRLTQVTEKDAQGAITQVVAYTYDVFNRRIAKAVDTTSPFTLTDAAIERYILDDAGGIASSTGGNVILDFVDPDGDGAATLDLQRRYLYGEAVDQILAQEDISQLISSADRVLFPLTDNLGTVRDLIKNDGVLGEHYKYDSFGNITSGNTSLTRYLFTSREFDTDTNLQYNRARYYDATTGRWLSHDPLSFAAGDTNTYRYAGNNVANLIDPSGLEIEISIHSSADPDGHFTSGHAWIEIVNTETGTRETYGLWPDDNLRTEDNGDESDVRLNLEIDYNPDYARYYTLNPEEEEDLEEFLDDPAFWTYSNTCAAWASQCIYNVVGEDVDSDDYWGFETPREISRNIEILEEADPTTPTNPAGPNPLPAPEPPSSITLEPLADPPGHPLYVCFPAGTLVHTADGMIQIEKINAGTMVWSFQIETGEWVLKPVLKLEENEYAGRMVSIISSGVELDATTTHPFWVVSGDRLDERPPARSLDATEKAATPFGRWVEAGALQLGDELLLRSGNTAIIAELNAYSRNLSVFNIAVEHLRNYCVGELGVLVHNT